MSVSKDPENKIREILVVSATEGELQATRNGFDHALAKQNSSLPIRLHFRCGGAGIPFMSMRMGEFLQSHRYSLVLHTGIAGAFPGKGLAIGDVVTVREEIFADLGLELPTMPFFQSLGDTSFAEPLAKQPLQSAQIQTGSRLALTVTMATGTLSTLRKWQDRHDPDIETMEGACVALACTQAHIPWIEWRAISNDVGVRSIDAQGISKALKALEKYVADFGHHVWQI